MGIFDTIKGLVAPAAVGAGAPAPVPELGFAERAWLGGGGRLTPAQLQAAGAPLDGTLWTIPGAPRPVLWHAGRFSALGGRPVEVADRTPCALWHPATSPRETTCVWADALEDLGVVQPFEQVWRASFPASRAGSQPALGWFLDREAFARAAARRGWIADPEGRHFERRDLRATLAVHPFDHRTSSTRYAVAGALTGALAEVDPVACSEALRDLDLCLLGGSVANDLRFSLGPEEPVWIDEHRARPWGELSPNGLRRAAQLTALIPRSPLAGRARQVGPALVVDADVTYRVHLDATRVRRAWSNTTVVVWPEAATYALADRLLLPIDGDLLLREVLARALELVAAPSRPAGP